MLTENKNAAKHICTHTYIYVRSRAFYQLSKFLDTFQQQHCHYTAMFMTQLQQVAHCPTTAWAAKAAMTRLALVARLHVATPPMTRCGYHCNVSTQSSGFSRRQQQILICWIALFCIFLILRIVVVAAVVIVYVIELSAFESGN